MRQLDFTLDEKLEWGRMLNCYSAAVGTGSRLIDPKAKDIGLHHNTWMLHEIEKAQLRAAWIGCGMSTTYEFSEWRNIDRHNKFFVIFSAYKIKKKMFSSPVYIASLTFILDYTEVNAGWLVAENFMELFDYYDLWLKGGVKPYFSFDDCMQIV